jgi:integrase
MSTSATRQRPAAAGERGSVAAGPGQGRYQDPDARRTLTLPQLAVTALQALHAQSAPDPGDLVFCTTTGQPLDAANVRRFFRAVCTAAGIGPIERGQSAPLLPGRLHYRRDRAWLDTTRAAHLRQPDVRQDVAVEEIARLVGHASSKVTEAVYRHQLRPVMTTGAEKMDALLGKAG